MRRTRATRATRVLTAVAVGVACSTLGGCGVLFQHTPKEAHATLLPTQGNQAIGRVDFLEREDGVQVTYTISGLSADSDHAFQVHEVGDCSAADASSARDAFDLPGVLAAGRRRHIGDLPNIHADVNGMANGFMLAPDLALDGVRSVVGRAIIVDSQADYGDSDDKRLTHIACGVIRR